MQFSPAIPFSQQLPDLNHVYDLRSLSYDHTGDEEVIRRGHLWLADCLSGHKNCGRYSKRDYYPPQLLQIDGDSVQLVETADVKMSGRYATLSYCWGRNPRHLTLTTQNADILQQGFQISHLGRTFRDTIRVLQSFSISLLWIDSLCILQAGEGHVEDWQKHVVEMAVIYTNCILNIAVDHGENAEAGCFTVRNAESIRPSVFEMPVLSQGRLNAALAQEALPSSHRNDVILIDSRYWNTLLQETPLMGRGWVHQERLLAPRVLHFGKTGLAWECEDLMASEAFPTGFSPGQSGELRPPPPPPLLLS